MKSKAKFTIRKKTMDLYKLTNVIYVELDVSNLTYFLTDNILFQLTGKIRYKEKLNATAYFLFLDLYAF